MPSSYSAIIAAGGSGSRFGGNKLREKLGGKAVLSHSLDIFDDDPDCEEIIVCAGPEVREWIAGSPLLFASTKLKVVEGGASRAESVANGARRACAAVLAIHDAARPNFTADLLLRLRKAAVGESGAVPALPEADTLAYLGAGGKSEEIDDVFGSGAGGGLGNIERHIDRANLYALQTPQLFPRQPYLDALNKPGELAGYADDSALYIAAGYSVTAVPGLRGNLKITTRADLQLLQKLMGGGEKKSKDKYGGLGW